MLFVPLPFVVTLLLLILLVQLVRQELYRNRLFASLLILYAFLSLLIGVRWGYGVRFLLPLQSVLAAGWASLAWLSFRQLAKGGSDILFSRDWVHLIPAISVFGLITFWPEPIDFLLITIYLVYGIALGRLALSGSDNLKMVRLDESPRAHLALSITAITLIAFSLIDILVSLDIRFWGGLNSAFIVSLANVPALLVLGFAAAIAGKGRVGSSELEKTVPALTESGPEDFEIIQQIDDLLNGKGVFRDFDLSLDRLARKSGITSRRISGAVNRVKGQNVSQYVNQFRVAEACRLLLASDQTITTVMLDAGFQTKSNFNREFRRVAGLSPKDWRRLFPNVDYMPDEME